jgi:histidine kinase
MLVEMVAQKVAAHHQADHALRCGIQPSLPCIRGDTEYLVEALEQLIDNAFRFTPPDGQVEVEVYSSGDQVCLTITDSGPGIPEEHLPRIFETFWRLDEAHSTPGFGLGLPIARRIIHMHNGEISVKTEPGSGTQVQVTLPALTSTAPGSPTQTTAYSGYADATAER